jgi:sirohydrochlorin ferrochelatase
VPDQDAAAAPPPALLAVAHGTREPAGIAAIEALLDEVRRVRPGLTVGAAYLEAARPSLRDSLRGLAGPVVVVPLLLAGGYHAGVDIPRAVAGVPGIAVSVAPVLGPHPLLAEALLDRLRDAGWQRSDRVVLGAAGSSEPAAGSATEAQARLLADLLGEPVVAAYASAAGPTVGGAVADLRAAGADRVAVASYLLAPGHFHAQLQAAGADLVSEPLGRHPAIAELVLVRYDHALG